ncbi:hypothetical protein ABZ858_10840 [Streptomyces sp. NPDC047017]|uniref:hypothetical protein n=1 Tax=Streptomyces sp. NPDC047017 TaxID=3155024 RepID=UPI0033CDE0CB
MAVLAGALLPMVTAGSAAAVSCSPQKVDSYTARTSCADLGTVRRYRVLVHCINNAGTTREITGPWRTSGWSTVTCSANQTSAITGYVETELGK